MQTYIPSYYESDGNRALAGLGTAGNALGQAIGSLIAGARKRPDKKQEATQKPKPDEVMEHPNRPMFDVPQHYAPIDITTPGVMSAVYDPYAAAQQHMDVNQLAAGTSVNGEFTQDGGDRARSDAELDAQDRSKARMMMGIGGTMTMHPGLGPGNF